MISAILASVISAAVMASSMPGMTIAGLSLQIADIASRTAVAAGFGIDQVSLTGQRYTLDADVFDALDLRNVKTFAALDTQAALKRIERISWVETAQLTRTFPGQLQVEIKERLPAAIWQRGDKNYLIDATGRTLGVVPSNGNWVLPVVSGEGANTDAALLLTAMSRHQTLNDHFAFAERIAERRWRVVLHSGSRIELGSEREVEGLDTIAANPELANAAMTRAVIVDVRTPGRPTVRPMSAKVATRAIADPLGGQLP